MISLQVQESPWHKQEQPEVCLCEHLADTAGASECNSKNKCIFPDGDKYEFTDTAQMLKAKPVILNN